MEVYIVDGRELTLEQFQAEVAESGLSDSQYRALYNVEVKTTTVATDATAGTGIASIQDADVKVKNIVGAAATQASTDSNLENINSALDLKLEEKRIYDKRREELKLIIEQGGNAPELAMGSMSSVFRKKGEKINNEIKKLGLDIDDIEYAENQKLKDLTGKTWDSKDIITTLSMQPEDVLIEWFKDPDKGGLPELFGSETEGKITNEIKIPGFGVINTSMFQNSEKTKEILNNLKIYKETRTDIDIRSISASSNIVDFFNSGGDVPYSTKITAVNALLKNTGYKIQGSDKLVEAGEEGEMDTVITLVDTRFPDAPPVYSGNLNGLKDWIKTNFTEKDFNSIVEVAGKAQNTYMALAAASIKQEAKKISLNQSERNEYFEEQFGLDLVDRLRATKKFNKEDIKKVEAYFESMSSRLGNSQGSVSKFIFGDNMKTDSYSDARKKLFNEKKNLIGLDEDLKNKIIDSLGVDGEITTASGESLFAQNILAETKNNVYANEFKKLNPLDKSIYNLATNFINTNKVLLKDDNKDFNTSIQKHYDHLVKSGDEDMVTLFKSHEGMFKTFKKYGVDFDITKAGGNLLFNTEGANKNLSETEQAELNKALNQLPAFQSTLGNINYVFNNHKDSIEKEINRYYGDTFQDNKNIETDLGNVVFTRGEAGDIGDREYGLGNLLVNDTSNAFGQGATSMLALFGGRLEDYAIAEQKLIQSKKELYDEMPEAELSLNYILRTGAQQSFNLSMAAALGGVGALGITTMSAGASMNLIAGGFGLTSVGQTKIDLNIQRDAAKTAIDQREKYRQALASGQISEYDYAVAMRDVNTTIAMGDLSDEQISSAAYANGAIEFLGTRFIGTAPNTLAMFKNLRGKVDASTLIKLAGSKNKLSRFYNAIGKPLTIRTGAELVEEELIYTGNQLVTEDLLLGRETNGEVFWKGFSETGWATLVIAGPTQTTSAVTGGMNALSTSTELKKIYNSNFSSQENLLKALASGKLAENSTQFGSFMTLLSREMKAVGLEFDKQAMRLLNMGSEKGNELMTAAILRMNMLNKIGVTNDMTPAQSNEIISEHRKTLKGQDLTDFNNDLQIVDKTIKDIQDQAYKPENYEKAKKALGPLYEQYKDRARANVQEGGTLNELVEIVNLIRKEDKNEVVKRARENPGLKQYVESLTNPDGTKYNAKQRLEIYYAFGSDRISRAQLVAFDVATQADKLFKNVDNVEVVNWKDVTELQKMLKAEGLSNGEVTNMVNSLTQNKKYGAIINGKIFSQDKKGYEDDLANGDVRAGTFIVHEFAHAKDDALMTEAGANMYQDNLFEAGQNTSNPLLKEQHDRAIDSVNEQFPEDAGKDFKDASQDYKDEYSKIFQELAYGNELGQNGLGLEKDKGFFEKTFLWDSPNNLNSSDKALNYMLDTNAAFRKGEITATDRSIIEASINKSKKGSTKPQVKNINELVIGKTYDQLKNNPQFRDQYEKIAITAMKYTEAKGDVTRAAAIQEAYIQLPSLIKTFNPDKGAFTTHVNNTLSPQRRSAAFYKQQMGEAGKIKIGKRQLIGEEDADAFINQEQRLRDEGELKLVDAKKLIGVPADIDNIIEIDKNEVVINPDSRSYTTDFRSISDNYGAKVAGAIYNINPDKLKKGADLTYNQNKVVDGRKIISEAEKIQSDYTNAQEAKKFISLFPEFNISTPTAITTKQGQQTKVDKDVQGRALGIAPSVLDYFYEPYIDPKALNKDTKKDAITNPSGRAKGTTSQTQVKRLKPEFRGSISNATIIKLQKNLGVTGRGEFNTPPKGKARTDFGRLLIGLANLKGAIVANTVVDQKIQSLINKGEIKSARTPEQIIASTRAGRSKIQFSTKAFALKLKNYGDLKTGKITNNTLKNLTLKELNNIGYSTVADVKNKFGLPLKKGDKTKLIEKSGYKMLSPRFENEFVPGLTEFLNNYPQYRNIIRQSTTSSLSRNSIGATPLFDRLFPKTDNNIEQKRDAYKTASTENARKSGKVGKLSQAFVKKVLADPDSFIGNQYAKLKVLETFMIDVQSFLNKPGNKNKTFIFEQILDDGQNNMGSLMRVSPPILYLPLKNGKIDFESKIREEHNFPANQIGSFLLGAAKDGRVEDAFKIVSAAYMQGPLTIDDDNKVNLLYSSTMPDIFWNKIAPRILKGELKIPEGFASVIRLTESNVNLDNYQLIDENKTFSEWLFGTNGLSLAEQKQFTREFLAEGVSLKDIKAKAKFSTKVTETVNKTFKPNASTVIAKDNTADKAMADARDSVKYSEKRKGISVFDFDDTLAQSNSNVLYTMPDGTTGSLTAGEFALEASSLTNLGAEFDFSEFNEVKEGRKGPLADVAIKRQGKFGSKDIFVLTARPQASDINIKKFLDEIGLNIPLENITGLENGTAEAKAEWMIGKYADGYNDFYFADDAFKNVEAVRNVFDVLDIKSKVQQARVKFSSKLDTDFNDMIERNMGVKSEAVYSDILARRKGKNQKRFAFFIPPSADDFRGLTMYTFAGKGKQGELDQDFFDKALIKPYMGGINAMELAKNRVKNAYKVLQKTSPNVRKKLTKKIGGTKYTHDQAIRIYLWNKDGVVIPGLSKTDQNQLVKLVEANTDLVAYAEGVKLITKKETYVPPNEFWDGTTIIGDLGRLSREINRNEYLKEFNDNADILFSPKNMNKIEAVYGFRVREALENSLYRMKTGSNKAAGSGRIVTAWNNWVNNSVGAIMFFNRRSALLQMLSAGNFVNWSDNNPLKAGLAFANQPQYWKDVVYIFNSPKLRARRQGLEGDIQEKEIAEASRKGGMEGVLSYLLKIGFTPTQIADSIAISTGGASFYRNRINTYKKEGYTVEDAEKKAFDDFSAISDETQQSADPMLISSQQAGVLGRLVLAFQNTPMQYTRLMKKAGQDLINRRGDPKTNISKILYYGFIQNLIFSTLQNAMFAFVPGFEDDEEEPDFKTDKERDAWLAKQGNREDKKVVRVANNMVDTILRGSGLAGAVVSTIKNVIMVYNEREDMTVLQRSRANADLLIALTSISPPISSKIRKINNALDIQDFEKDVIAERGYSVMIDDRFQLSPQYDVIGNVASATLNLPLDRVFSEVNSITEALDDRNSAYQRLALGLGWKTWDVNAKIEEHDLIKTEAKAKRKIEGIEKGKATRKTNKELEKNHERLRRSIIFKLPKPIKDSLIRKEREDKKITAIYKLNQLKAKYIE